MLNVFFYTFFKKVIYITINLANCIIFLQMLTYISKQNLGIFNFIRYLEMFKNYKYLI